MARSFHPSLLAAAAAAVIGGLTPAQDTPLQEAVVLLRVGKKDEAVAKLREILQADPSNEEAHRYYQSVSQDEWYLLMTEQGEIQQIARSILERAQLERRERSRDEAAIAELVAAATASDGDYRSRQSAINALVANHGEFAVPALVAKLGDPDDPEGQILAINALSQLRAAAVLPLIATLASSNDLLVQNAAAALHLIGDPRARPYMHQLAEDPRANVRAIASRFLDKHGRGGDAVALMVAQGREYLKANVPYGGYSEVVWQLADEQLVAVDVPQMLYPYELAKAVAADALRILPGNLDAQSLLAQANLAQAYLIETSIAQGDSNAQALEAVLPDLRIAALVTGTPALRAALEAGVRDGLAPVAIGAIQALAQAEAIDSIDRSPLVAALGSSDKRVKYAAAAALVRASRGQSLPEANRVVGILAEAVTEEAVRTIQVIAPAIDAAAAVETTSRIRGYAVGANASAVDGMRSLLRNPNIDVVVINEILPDRLPEDIIGNIRKDPRMTNTRIVVVAKDEEAARERFGDEVGIVLAPLSSENLVTAVNTALEGITNPSQERAERYAAKASEALLALASRKADISGAVQNLALQLNRGDSVAVPAAKALGLSGTEAQLPALVDGLTGSGSDELKKACAEGLGNLLGRMASCPDDVAAAMLSALDAASDPELRLAIAIAVGKAKLDGARKLQFLRKLNRVAGAGNGDEG